MGSAVPAGGRVAKAAMRLFSTATLLSAARIAGALAGFVTQVVLARALHASALGLFFSVTSMAALVSLIAAHGYPAIAARFLSRYRKQGNQQWVAAFIARARRDAALYVSLAVAGIVAFALLWPGLSQEARFATIAAAMSVPASAAIRVNGAFAATLRRFALSYLPDTCIRPFLLLGGIVLLLAVGVPLTASGVTWLLTAILSGLALAQYLVLTSDMPKRVSAPAPAPVRLVKIWQREATPLIVVALIIYFFADVDILMVTPLLTSAETAIIGLCLKLALLVGFAVQVTHQVAVPDLAEARARKDGQALREALIKALGFPLLITFAATAGVAAVRRASPRYFRARVHGREMAARHLDGEPARARGVRTERDAAHGRRRAEGKRRARRRGAGGAGARQSRARAALRRARRGARRRTGHALLAHRHGHRARAARHAPDGRDLSPRPARVRALGDRVAARQSLNIGAGFRLATSCK